MQTQTETTTAADVSTTPTTESPELAALRARMEAHDWLYVMAEGNAYWNGRSVEDSIRLTAYSTPGGMALFEEYVRNKRKKYGL